MLFLNNDSDIEESELFIRTSENPEHGTATITEDSKTIFYTPAENFYGRDTFYYSATDGQLVSEPVRITVTVVEDDDKDDDGESEITDCDDTNSNVYNGAPEVCDGLDNNCDGNLPEDEVDSDNDGLIDCQEACYEDPDKYDSGQCGCGIADSDSDNDHIADCIDDDIDGDTILNEREEELGLNPWLEDSDGDNISDNIELGDPEEPRDTDGDGIIDALDLDSDNDGISDFEESGDRNGSQDSDNDGIPNYLDRDSDSDSDEVDDSIDNCPWIFNPEQEDENNNGIGDSCDSLTSQSKSQKDSGHSCTTLRFSSVSSRVPEWMFFMGLILLISFITRRKSSGT